MRVIEALAARCAPGNTSGPKSSLRKARITPPCETMTISSSSGWLALMVAMASPNLAMTSSSVSAPTSVQRSSSGMARNFFASSGFRRSCSAQVWPSRSPPCLSLRPPTGTTSPAKLCALADYARCLEGAGERARIQAFERLSLERAGLPGRPVFGPSPRGGTPSGPARCPSRSPWIVRDVPGVVLVDLGIG